MAYHPAEVPSGYKGITQNSIERNKSINYRNPYNILESMDSPVDANEKLYKELVDKSIGQITTLENNKPLRQEVIDTTSSLLQNHNIVNKYHAGFFEKFSRFGYIDPYNIAKKTKEYLFFTRPDLHIFDGGWSLNPELGANSTFFADVVHNYRWSAYMLQNSMNFPLPFVPMLSNAVSSSLELPGISADYIETAKNVYGTAMHYRGSSFKSDQDFDFSLDFREGKDLDVYMYFRLYDEYERLKWLGQVSPPDEYITNKILHDQFSIYKFIVAEDGMTILYYARVVGVMPTSVPRDAIGNMEGDFTIPVSFHGKFVYDMDPRIIREFNYLMSPMVGGKKFYDLYDKTNNEFDGRWAACPYITSQFIGNRQRYYLRWLI